MQKKCSPTTRRLSAQAPKIAALLVSLKSFWDNNRVLNDYYNKKSSILLLLFISMPGWASEPDQLPSSSMMMSYEAQWTSFDIDNWGKKSVSTLIFAKVESQNLVYYSVKNKEEMAWLQRQEGCDITWFCWINVTENTPEYLPESPTFWGRFLEKLCCTIR